MTDRAGADRTLLGVLGPATAAWLLWAVAMGLASESMCFNGEGRHWWPPSTDCENGNTDPGDVEVGMLALFGPFVSSVVASGLLVARGAALVRTALAAVVLLPGFFAIFW